MTTPIIGGGVAGTWIKCSERMPGDAPVMAFGDGVYVAVYDGDAGWRYWPQCTQMSMVVSHWMPLPPGPTP